MKKILISASSSREMTLLDVSYSDAIRLAGGLPFMVAPTDELEVCEEAVKLCDGLLLTGGVDVSPFLYGENPSPKTQTPNDMRDQFELELLKIALREKKEVLAVCRGFQLIQAAFGGSLVQDIPTERPESLEHARPNVQPSYHYIDLEEGSRFHEIMGVDQIIVNSIHHQGVLHAAEGLKVTATSEDGFVECVEADHLIAFQFHPERLIEDEDFLRIFEDFIGRA
ncbi:gamma-glutamyl-gamma-aminobutyrate hydrolase family protein [Guggenheimella bovis]